MNKKLIPFLVLFVLGILAGCTGVPEDRAESARVAIQNAESAEAETYAPEAISAAKASLAKMEEELRIQNDKFSLLRRYGHAEELAAAAESAGVHAAQAAVEGKAKAREEAMASLSEMKTVLESTKTLLANAVTGKGTEADLEAMRQDLLQLEGTAAEIEKAIAEGQFTAARSKAEMASDAIHNIESALMAAKEHQATKSKT